MLGVGLVAHLLMRGPRSSLCTRSGTPGRRGTADGGSHQTEHASDYRRYLLIHAEIVARFIVGLRTFADADQAAVPRAGPLAAGG
ncbi:hypothetical protein [Streptomyces sp. NPDC059906]|uniref:hypothetical protein n=1 Tax=Streptomyces sp. NPDC059906 TaxID=3346997 RepID=UPI0036490DBC